MNLNIIGSVFERPKEFNEPLITTIKLDPEKELDEKLYELIVENDLPTSFLKWVVENNEWGKMHPSLVSRVMLLSIIGGTTKSIEMIKNVSNSIWNKSFLDQIIEDDFLEEISIPLSFLSELTKYIQIKNSLNICLYLFKYIQSEWNPDLNLVKDGFSVLSREEKDCFLELTENELNIFQICIQRNLNEIFDFFIKSKTKEEVKKIVTSDFILYWSVVHKNIDVINIISEVLSEDEYLELVRKIIENESSYFWHNADFIEALIIHVPDIHRAEILSIQDQKANLGTGKRLLDKAIYYGLNEIVTKILYLVSEKNRIHLITRNSNPLFFAIKRRQGDILKVIFNSLSNEAQAQAVEFCDDDGKNLFHYISEFGNDKLDDFANQIINIKSFELINSLDKTNKTPLHYAAKNSNLNTLKIYIDLLSPTKFLDELIKQDSSSKNPFYYAILFGNFEFNKILVNHSPLINKKFNEFAEIVSDEMFMDFRYIKQKIKTLLCPNSAISSKFKVRQSKNQLDLMARDKVYLLEKWDLIAKYTQKIDPEMKIEPCKIKKVKASEDLKAGFKHYIDLHKTLASSVAAAYGHQHGDLRRNCHGSALFASGLSERLTYLDSPHSFTEFKDLFEEIQLKNISCGDLVYLKSSPLRGEENSIMAHSFIYLSPDFCLSMNGFNKKLKFYSIRFVLNVYGYPRESLDDKPSKWADRISIYRKLSSFTFDVNHVKLYYNPKK